jgi:hypothetical protein
MNIDQVKKRVDYIRTIAGDDEAAHTEEDDLHMDVLKAIADGNCADPSAIAREALATGEIKFNRWCA